MALNELLSKGELRFTTMISFEEEESKVLTSFLV